ncbi:MAG: hypothetical protein M1438_08360, partial [Deltaproteobacteria bacterium]|nr:hypothetical protein [Deltaproteobacteria bacterium]
GLGTFTQTGGANTVTGNLQIGFNSTGSGTYNLSNGSLTVSGNENVGGSGSGDFIQSSGSHTVSNTLTLANNSGSSGTYILNGGNLSAGTIKLKDGGLFNQTGGTLDFGTFNQTGGTASLSDLVLGRTPIDSNVYLLSGGSLIAANEYVGLAGSGAFTQTDGANTVAGTLNIASLPGSSGTYSLKGGNLAAGAINLNTGGKFNQTGGTLDFGTFNQTGGTGAFTDLVLGRNPGDSSIYSLSGGNLRATNEYVGYDGNGSFIQSNGSHTVGTLTLASNSGASGAYNLSNGRLTAGTVNLNANGTFLQTGGSFNFSTFNQTGGDAAFSSLYLGRGPGDTSTYNLSGGNLVATYEAVGYNGTGIFNQSGGINTVADGSGNGELDLGRYLGASGSYNLSNGSLLADNEYIGYAGSGAFSQSGGSHAVGQLSLAEEAGSRGTYDLQNGTLASAVELIGDSGTGIFTQSGGTHTAFGFIMGVDAGSSGSYDLSGGSLSTYAEAIGFAGSGAFTQSAGTHTIDDGLGTGELDLGLLSGSTGTYNLNGGSLSAAFEIAGILGTGAFTQSGGNNTMHDGLGTGGLGLGVAGTGSYTLSGGSLNADLEFIGLGGTGTFTQNGGSNTTTAITLAGTGTYYLQGGSLTAGTIMLFPGGTFNQTGGSLNAQSFNQLGGEVQGSLENEGTFNYTSGLFSGRLLNYGSINLGADFTAGNGLANYTSFSIDPGRTVTLNGSGLDNQGSLMVNGTLAGGGPLLNNTGGILSGSGTIRGNFTNRGTVSPGNSPGTLNVVGSYTQTASGTLVAEIASPTNYDRINVTGTANLDGTVKPVLLGGYVPRGNQTFTVVSVSGGVSGTFATIADRFISPTLAWQARYSPYAVDLRVARDYANPGLHLTPNQQAVGNMLNGLADNATGDLNYVMDTIDSLSTASQVAGAFQQISADKAASLTTLGFAGANLFRQGLANRITNLRYGSMAGAGGSGGPGGFSLSGSRLDGLMLAYNSSSLAGLLTAKKKAPAGTSLGLYLDPGLILGGQKSSINQTGFNFTIAGFTAGADYRLRDDLLVGLATGYGHTGSALHGSGGGVESHTWPLTAYAGSRLPA